MALNKVSKFIKERMTSDSYWVESAKIDFSFELEKMRKHSGLTYAEISQKIGSSAAYISKVFKGDANFTIESMVKLSRATGGKLHIKICDENYKVETQVWAGKIHHLPAANQQHVSPIITSTIVEEYKAAA